MKATEREWKAAHLFSVWKSVQSRVCLNHNMRYSQLRDGDKDVLRQLASQSVVMDKAWQCERKRLCKKSEANRSQYRAVGLSAAKALRGR